MESGHRRQGSSSSLNGADCEECLKQVHDPADVTICGYYPGVIGLITQLHATYYHEYWGFDVSFEAQVGRELSRFMEAFQPDRDILLVGKVRERFAAAIAIDGSLTGSEGARLRWFIVDPEMQGLGLGKKLLGQAIGFCVRAGHRKVILWTFKGLDPARHLYESAGFRLSETHRVEQWGSTIDEQRFELIL